MRHMYKDVTKKISMSRDGAFLYWKVNAKKI